jgi:hypothetical protein
MNMCMLYAQYFILCMNYISYRTQRRAERQIERRAEQAEGLPKAKKPKKKQSVTPEMEERQARAAARMQELGVPPLQVSICLSNGGLGPSNMTTDSG